MMSEASQGSVPHAEQKEVGPNYFGYYIREIVELFSQKEEFFSPSSSQVEDIGYHCCNAREANNLTTSSSLFSNGIGNGFPDLKRERLKASLKQGVIALNQEVDEMVNPVIAMCQIKTHLRDKECSPSCSSASNGDLSQPPCKKQTILSSSLTGIPMHAGTVGSGSCSEKDDDLRFLLENGGLQAEEIVKKHSDELFAKLGHMEQQLEELLDNVVSKCRPMTLAEKQELRKLIQHLPPKNLDRIVEIVQRSKPPDSHPCNEIYIDLEKEDNATLWRLYYYVEAVASAKKFSS